MHGGDTSCGTPRNELSILNHQMFKSPAPAEKGGGAVSQSGRSARHTS